MGDISSETSMEDILSSIKRIIAEEGDGAAPVRGRKAIRPGNATPAVTMPARSVDDGEEVLELKDAVPPRVEAQPDPRPEAPIRSETPVRSETPRPSAGIDPSILSERVAEASRAKLESLSRMIVRPETPGTDSLEGLVRDMLRPMLRDWLDANLPEIVEQMVSREIARITARD